MTDTSTHVISTLTTPITLGGRRRKPVSDRRAELLTAAEEVELATRIEAGVLAGHALATGRLPPGASASELQALERDGVAAFRRFVEANVALVGSVVREESERAGRLESDVFQDGCLGLIEAVRRFDHRRGCKFSTYAMYWIRALVRVSTARRGGRLDLPVLRAEQLRRTQSTQRALSQQLGREASAAELGQTLGRSPAWVAGLLAQQSQLSVDDDLLGVQVRDRAADRALEQVLTGAMPGSELLDHLDADQRQVIVTRFGFADGGFRTYAATARTLGLTTGRVRSLERRALEVLRGVCPAEARAHL